MSNQRVTEDEAGLRIECPACGGRLPVPRMGGVSECDDCGEGVMFASNCQVTS